MHTIGHAGGLAFTALHDSMSVLMIKDVVCCAMIPPESRLTSSPESMLFSPATDAPLRHCSIQFGQDGAHCDATTIV